MTKLIVPKNFFNRFWKIILIILLALVWSASLIPNIYNELSSWWWVRSELYFTAFTQILFFIGLYFYLMMNMMSHHWQRRYLLNIFVLSFLMFYIYWSTFYDPAFPTLAALMIYSIVFMLIIFILDLVMTFILPKSPN